MFTSEFLNKETGSGELNFISAPAKGINLEIIKAAWTAPTPAQGDKSAKDGFAQILFQIISPGVTQGKFISGRYYKGTDRLVNGTLKKGSSWRMKQLLLATGLGDQNGHIMEGFTLNDLINRTVLADIVPQYNKNDRYEVVKPKPIPSGDTVSPEHTPVNHEDAATAFPG